MRFDESSDRFGTVLSPTYSPNLADKVQSLSQWSKLQLQLDRKMMENATAAGKVEHRETKIVAVAVTGPRKFACAIVAIMALNKLNKSPTF